MCLPACVQRSPETNQCPSFLVPVVFSPSAFMCLTNCEFLRARMMTPYVFVEQWVFCKWYCNNIYWKCFSSDWMPGEDKIQGIIPCCPFWKIPELSRSVSHGNPTFPAGFLNQFYAVSLWQSNDGSRCQEGTGWVGAAQNSSCLRCKSSFCALLT